MSQLQELFREAQEQWKAWGKWKDADLPDAVDFMITEAVEVLRERLRLQDPGYCRNAADRDIHHAAAVTRMGMECVDTIMMACRVLDCLGLDFDVLAAQKLEAMTDKRRPQRCLSQAMHQLPTRRSRSTSSEETPRT